MWTRNCHKWPSPGSRTARTPQASEFPPGAPICFHILHCNPETEGNHWSVFEDNKKKHDSLWKKKKKEVCSLISKYLEIFAHFFLVLIYNSIPVTFKLHLIISILLKLLGHFYGQPYALFWKMSHRFLKNGIIYCLGAECSIYVKSSCGIVLFKSFYSYWFPV